MMALVDRAVALNPSYARGREISGTQKLWAGHPDNAIEHVEARCGSAPAPASAASITIGVAHFPTRRFDQAAPKLFLAIQENLESPSLIVCSPPAMPIWGGSLKPEDCPAAARHHPSRCRATHAQPRAARTVALGPTPGGGRGDMTQTAASPRSSPLMSRAKPRG